MFLFSHNARTSFRIIINIDMIIRILVSSYYYNPNLCGHYRNIRNGSAGLESFGIDDIRRGVIWHRASSGEESSRIEHRLNRVEASGIEHHPELNHPESNIIQNGTIRNRAPPGVEFEHLERSVIRNRASSGMEFSRIDLEWNHSEWSIDPPSGIDHHREWKHPAWRIGWRSQQIHADWIIIRIRIMGNRASPGIEHHPEWHHTESSIVRNGIIWNGASREIQNPESSIIRIGIIRNGASSGMELS